ncbi:MAG: helix-turn-helix transcriptional regulator [Dehalococcoidia bacterium]|nr:helix-turn-helix transcriptional regulator [Dehalococcoidia bacterium]
MLKDMQNYGPLDNYISTHRRMAGLSQDELAVLMGNEMRESIGRYEQGIRRVDLHGALALEVILDEPLQYLFAGVSEKVRADVARRAKALLEGMTDKPNAKNAEKLATLDRLAHLDDDNFIAWEPAA